jgi:SH3-like domain-containing protein
MKYVKIVFFLLVLYGCTPHEVPQNIQNGLDSISLKWVPDKREGVCQYTLSLVSGNSVVLKGETSIPEAKNEIIAFLSDKGFEVTDSLKTLPDDLVEKKWGLVKVSVCNIMGKPSFSGEQVTQALMGTPVRILKISDGWMLIQTPDHYIGWVNDSSISEKDDDEMNSWKDAVRIIYTARNGDIAASAGKSGIISDITAGAILEVSETDRESYYVKLPDGRTGIIGRRDAADFDQWCASVSPDTAVMTEFAKRMTGYPYMWGGTSTKAVDCSGFVKTIYFTQGIILTRDASQQFLYGRPIDVSASLDLLEPGDLIFFGHLRNDGSERITHVGMYIGDTEVIHSSGMVRINSLDPGRANYSSYLKQTMMGARRLIGLPGQPGLQSVRDHPWYFNQQPATSNQQQE